MNELSLLILHLTLIKNVGPAAILQILDKCFGFSRSKDCEKPRFSVDDVYKFSVTDFVRVVGLKERMAGLCTEGLASTTLLEKELELARHTNSQIITLIESDYPEALLKIHMPPPVLWLQGKNLGAQKKRLAVVGARRCDARYAKSAIRRLVPELVASGWQIVSGGAFGVDAIAHEETIESGGSTAVVLGSGLLQLYPRENKRLFGKVVENGGSLISPFPLKMVPEKGNFPARNRVIAGLCAGCVVVQAKERSGALITASHALEEGREVWAVPGPVDCELSEGPHNLLRDGANIAACGDDILSVLEGRRFNGEKFKISVPKSKNEPTQATIADSLEVKILSELRKPCSLEELAQAVLLDPQNLMENLFEMQLLGKVQQNHTGMWEAA
ncbi:DNA-processing protein DprA [Candidatus Dependentiae bacterium]